MAFISALLIRPRAPPPVGLFTARYPAFSASVSAIHTATVAGLAPASSAARYWASLWSQRVAVDDEEYGTHRRGLSSDVRSMRCSARS